MEQIYVYYNPNNDKFYYKICISNNLIVGETNSYGHILIQKIEFISEKIYDVDYYNNLLEIKKIEKQEKAILKRKRKLLFKNLIKKLINHLIDLLYTFKSRI